MLVASCALCVSVFLVISTSLCKHLIYSLYQTKIVNIVFFCFCSRKVDHQRMRKCLVTETETLLHLSGVKRITSVYFGGG